MSGAAAWIGPAIVAAVISAVVTGLGWLVSERQAAKREAVRRQERVVDMQTAILAEIRAHRHQTTNVQIFTTGVLRHLESSPDFTPFVPRHAPSVIFEALLAELHILPTSVIDPVVIYYRQLATISFLVEDLRTDRFAQLGPERKRAMYSDYADLLLFAEILGDLAADAIMISLSMTDGGSSARKSGAARGAASDRGGASRSNS